MDNIVFPETVPFASDAQVLEIFKFPHAVLRKKGLAISTFDADLKKFCSNLLYTMYMCKGIGLAAPQVGVLSRIFVIDISYKRETIADAEGKSKVRISNMNPLVFVNPELVDGNGEIIYEEGCLSLPGIYEKVTRQENINLKYYDLDGQERFITANGLLAVSIQHENDHLEGKVFLDRLSFLKRDFWTKKFLKGNKK